MYPRGARLADGAVRSVEAGEVWLETDAGALRVPLGAGSR